MAVVKTSQAIIVLILALTAILAAGSPDPILTFGIGASFVFGIYVLWPPNGIPILLLPFILQMVSVSIKPVTSALTGQPLEELIDRGNADLTDAVWFSLVALVALAVGMRLASGVEKQNTLQRLQASISHMSANFVIRACILAILAGHALDFASSMAGPLRQPVLMMASIKLAGLFFLTYWCLSRQRNLVLLTAVLGFEIIYGMTGYFGEFRPVVLITMLAALMAKPRIRASTLFIGAIAGLILMSTSIFWSAIKPEYRAYMSNGSQVMGSARPIGERAEYLANAMVSFDEDDFKAGLEAFTSRLSYIDFLAHTQSYVPNTVPHTDGSQTLQSVTFLIPRALWSDKPIVPHDTEVTARFTGLHFNSMFASISIGYLGELYVDFGTVGAILAMLILGCFIGSIYRIIVNYQSLQIVYNLAIAASAVLPFVYFERALLKLVGGSITTFLACLVIQRLILPRALTILRKRKKHRLGRPINANAMDFASPPPHERSPGPRPISPPPR